MSVHIEAVSSCDEAMQLAELAATALFEAFFATALQQNVIPHTEQYTICVTVNDEVAEPGFAIDKLSVVGELTWPKVRTAHLLQPRIFARTSNGCCR